jgi:hypothetical protein
MKKKIRILLALAALSLLQAGMSSRVTQADSGRADYVYLIGVSNEDEPLCDPDLPPYPAVAMAPNGDTLDFAGKGTLSIHSKSVTGQGCFTHHFTSGFEGHGTWTAEKLLSFVEYGCEEHEVLGLVCGGQAVILVHLGVPGLFEGDGILQVDSAIANSPSGASEGVRLAVPGAINFNTAVNGPAVFILQP